MKVALTSNESSIGMSNESSIGKVIVVGKVIEGKE
jgi:hypothetical protein